MKKNRYKKRKSLWQIIISLSFIAILTVGAVAVALGIFIYRECDTDIDVIIDICRSPSSPTLVYTVGENGDLVQLQGGVLGDGKNRIYADREELGEDIVNAFVAIEDKRFYDHNGVDLLTSIKAAAKYLVSSTRSPGGSTITQQLVKNLTGDDSYSIKRKLSEMIRAVKLEKVMEKDEIITAYLNNIYLANNIYGVKTAAEFYFSCEISELSLAQCASIAAITRAPAYYDPVKNPENNLKRRNIILAEMRSQGYISDDEYESAVNESLELKLDNSIIAPTVTSWYIDSVIEEAALIISKEKNISYSSAVNLLYIGGYKIVIPMNENIQRILEDKYKERIFGDVESAFVVTDPESGYVLGCVGGMGEKSASRVLNRANTLRSPGSAIKPLSVYAPAIDEGIISYSSVYDDIPIEFGNGDIDSLWPKNADRVYKGLCTLEYAVKHSVNTVAAKVAAEYTVEKSYSFLESIGISSLVDGEYINGSYYSDKTLGAIALGGMTRGVSLLEMTAAYGIFPSEGLYSEPSFVVSIYERDGSLLFDNARKKTRVISVESAQLMTTLLSSVVNESAGTAYGYITKTPKVCETAGKTGTTSNSNDRWFIGYTPSLCAGIWVGYDTPQKLSTLEYGAHLKLWDEIMYSVLNVFDSEKRSFSRDTLIEASYCADSGKIITGACVSDLRGSRARIGYFKKSDMPDEYCDRHISVSYCTEGEGIAGEFCEGHTVQVGMLLYRRSMPYDICVTDSEYLYIETENITANRFLPFYFSEIKEGEYVGRSSGEFPKNRFCTRHNAYAVVIKERITSYILKR